MATAVAYEQRELSYLRGAEAQGHPEALRPHAQHLSSGLFEYLFPPDSGDLVSGGWPGGSNFKGLRAGPLSLLAFYSLVPLKIECSSTSSTSPVRCDRSEWLSTCWRLGLVEGALPTEELCTSASHCLGEAGTALSRVCIVPSVHSAGVS